MRRRLTPSGLTAATGLALRHPDLVRSLVLQSTWARADVFMRTTLERTFPWLVASAPDDRAMLEAFFLWVYTPRAHNEGLVAQFIEEVLAFPHPQSLEAFLQQLATWREHDAFERLHEISAPTLVLAGGIDMMAGPHMGRIVADRIPGAEFRVLDGEAHQPFQERPEEWNAIVHDFWTRV